MQCKRKGFNKYLVDALSVDTSGAVVTKNGAGAYRPGGGGDRIRSYYGAGSEGRDTRGAPGLEWGSWVG